MAAKTATRPTPPKTRKRIVAVSDMTTEQFALHFTHRHRSSLADMDELPADISHEVEQMYRSFHTRLHLTRVTYKH